MLIKDTQKEKSKLGITYDDKARMKFNVNQFTRFFLGKYTLKSFRDEFLLYLEGEDYWETLKEKDLKKLIKKNFEEVDQDIWKPNFSKQCCESIELSIEDMKKPNSYGYKLNVRNGVYNFRRFKMELHCIENNFTYVKDYPLSEDENPTPVFDKFINDIALGREALKNYLLNLLAYLVSGDKKLQNFFILKGSGANGKSTFMNLVSGLVGEEITTSTSLSKLSERFALAPMVGKRLVIASENENNKAISTEILKKLTGDDLVEIEEKYKDRFSIKLEVETLFAINNIIRFSENSHGLKRRLVVIPFDLRIKEADMDPDFEKKLKKEIPDIMRKLIGVHYEFAKSKYKLPYCKEVEEAKVEFLNEGIESTIDDEIFDFLEENIIVDSESRVDKNNVYRLYETGVTRKLPSSEFWKHFKKWTNYKGMEVKDKRNGARYKVGIRLKNKKSEKLNNVLS